MTKPVSSCVLAAMVLHSAVTLGQELEVGLTVSGTEVSELSPIAATINVRNKSAHKVQLPQPLRFDFGTLGFEAQRPGSDEFKSIPYAGATVSALSPQGEEIPAECLLTFHAAILPTERRPFFDEPGTWLVRAYAVRGRGRTLRSEGVPVVVRKSDSDSSRTAMLKVNNQVIRALASNPNLQVTSHDELVRLRTEPGLGKEVRQTIRWLAAVWKIVDAEPEEVERDYLSARELQNKLPEEFKKLMALKLAWILFKLGKDDLAAEQLSLLGRDSRQRTQLEYEVSERRREGQWPTPLQPRP